MNYSWITQITWIILWHTEQEALWRHHPTVACDAAILNAESSCTFDGGGAALLNHAPPSLHPYIPFQLSRAHFRPFRHTYRSCTTHWHSWLQINLSSLCRRQQHLSTPASPLSQAFPPLRKTKGNSSVFDRIHSCSFLNIRSLSSHLMPLPGSPKMECWFVVDEMPESCATRGAAASWLLGPGLGPLPDSSFQYATAADRAPSEVVWSASLLSSTSARLLVTHSPTAGVSYSVRRMLSRGLGTAIIIQVVICDSYVWQKSVLLVTD